MGARAIACRFHQPRECARNLPRQVQDQHSRLAAGRVTRSDRLRRRLHQVGLVVEVPCELADPPEKPYHVAGPGAEPFEPGQCIRRGIRQVIEGARDLADCGRVRGHRCENPRPLPQRRPDRLSPDPRDQRFAARRGQACATKELRRACSHLEADVHQPQFAGQPPPHRQPRVVGRHDDGHRRERVTGLGPGNRRDQRLPRG